MSGRSNPSANLDQPTVGEKVSEMGQQLRDVGQQAKEVAREQIGQIRRSATEYYEQGRDKAAEYYERGRDTAMRWEQGMEGYIREQPIKSILMAAGAGLVLGFLWRRR